MIKTIFFNNYLLLLPVVSWLAAQLIKTVLYFIMNKDFSAERLVGAGGMPSSHSALVCSLVVGTYRKLGPETPYFAIVFVLALIVMYDAMGVRLETGRQAKIINYIMENFNNKEQVDHFKKLKEMVGHTPFQVFAGAILGIVIALLIPVF